MYPSGSYHPAAFIDRYPAFILGRWDVFRYRVHYGVSAHETGGSDDRMKSRASADSEEL